MNDLGTHLAAALDAHRIRLEHTGRALPTELADLLDRLRVVNRRQSRQPTPEPCDRPIMIVLEPLLDRRQTAALLSISVTTLDRLVATGQLRARHIGGSVRFHPDDITALIEDA